MKLLKLNERDIEYLPYLGMSDIDPETGLHTGDPKVQYGEPIPLKGNLSTPSRNVNPTFYGEDIRYTHTLMLMLPKDVKIDEYGLFRSGEDIFKIMAVRESLNHFVAVALQRQTKNHAETVGE